MERDQERRRHIRNKVHLPVDMIIKGKVAASGHVVDMTYYGVKIEVLLKISNGKTTLKDLFSNSELIGLEIGNRGENAMHLNASAGVKWHTYSCGETQDIYMAGMELMLAVPDQDA